MLGGVEVVVDEERLAPAQFVHTCVVGDAV